MPLEHVRACFKRFHSFRLPSINKVLRRIISFASRWSAPLHTFQVTYGAVENVQAPVFNTYCSSSSSSTLFAKDKQIHNRHMQN